MPDSDSTSPQFEVMPKKLEPSIRIEIHCGDGKATVYDLKHDDSEASRSEIPSDAAHYVETWLARHLGSPSHTQCNLRYGHRQYTPANQGEKWEPCYCTWRADHGAA